MNGLHLGSMFRDKGLRSEDVRAKPSLGLA